MLEKLQNRKESGFTIVEVMIVLAIAGLIILIVFLAVPALQRNSRNTQRSSDISSLLGGVSEYAAANNGSLTGLTTALLTANARTAFYEGIGAATGNINVITGTPVQTALPASAAGDRVVVVVGAKCGAAGATVAGPSRAVAAQFVRETAGGYTPACQDS